LVDRILEGVGREQRDDDGQDTGDTEDERIGRSTKINNTRKAYGERDASIPVRSIPSKRFHWSHNGLAEHYQLRPVELAVYDYLAELANQAQQCWPSIKAIASARRCSHKPVSAALKRLVALKLVHIAPRPSSHGQTSNLYTLLQPQIPANPPLTSSTPDDQTGSTQNDQTNNNHRTRTKEQDDCTDIPPTPYEGSAHQPTADAGYIPSERNVEEDEKKTGDLRSRTGREERPGGRSDADATAQRDHHANRRQRSPRPPEWRAIQANAAWPSVDALVTKWNRRMYAELPRKPVVNPNEEAIIQAWLDKVPDEAWWDGLMEEIRRSDYLHGVAENSNGWRADFMWLFGQSSRDGEYNAFKVISGTYRDVDDDDD
jgi:Helix-turn-helix domain